MLVDKIPEDRSKKTSTEPKDPRSPKLLFNLTTQNGGFRQEQAAFLFHLVRLQSDQNWVGIQAKELVITECDPKNHLIESSMKRAATRLQALKWDEERLPYVVKLPTPQGKEGYGTTDNFIRSFRRARIAIELIAAKRPVPYYVPDQGVITEEFKKHLWEAFSMKEGDIETDLAYMVEHRYIDFYSAGSQPMAYIRATSRCHFESRYLSRLAELFVPRTDQTEGVTVKEGNQDSPPLAPPKLPCWEVDLLKMLASVEHQTDASPSIHDISVAYLACGPPFRFLDNTSSAANRLKIYTRIVLETLERLERGGWVVSDIARNGSAKRFKVTLAGAEALAYRADLITEPVQFSDEEVTEFEKINKLLRDYQEWSDQHPIPPYLK